MRDRRNEITLRKVGRPAAQVDFRLLDLALIYQHTLMECAALCGVHHETLEKAVMREKGKMFREYAEEKRMLGRVDVTQMLWKAAKKGNIQAQIHLDKYFNERWEKRVIMGDRDNPVNFKLVDDEKMSEIIKELAEEITDDAEIIQRDEAPVNTEE
jgi:hypothetical protein